MCRDVDDYRTKDFINYKKFNVKESEKTSVDSEKIDSYDSDYDDGKIENFEPDFSSSTSESTLPKSIYDLDLERLKPGPDTDTVKKYKLDDLKDAYPDKFKEYERDGGDDSFRYWIYKKVQARLDLGSDRY